MQYRKDLSVCHVSIVIICTLDIVGRSSVIAACTVSNVNICSVGSVFIFAVGSLGIGYGIIVTVCTSCNVSKNIVNLSSVSILSVYNVRMCTAGNVGKRNLSKVRNCIVSSVRSSSVCIVTMCTSSIVSVFTVCNLRYM